MAILLIHGGAGSHPEDVESDTVAGLERACHAGYVALTDDAAAPAERSAALAGALAAVSSMEANPAAFNAGIGGSPTRDGTVELDAAVMLSDGSSGAVTLVRNTPFAARLAERVRTDTPHALLAAYGAEALVDDPVPNEHLLTPRSLAGLERWRAGLLGTPAGSPAGSGTVGAVALDDAGRLAAVTSTGGMVGKWSGRVGDTPIVGAGTYADERVAVSCTGRGEAFMRAVTAKALADALAAGAELDSALSAALEGIRRQGGTGGLIAVTADGAFGMAFNSASMALAWSTPMGAEARLSRAAGINVMRAP